MDCRDIFVPSGGDLQAAIDQIQMGTIILERGGVYQATDLKFPPKMGTCYLVTEGATLNHDIPTEDKAIMEFGPSGATINYSGEEPEGAVYEKLNGNTIHWRFISLYWRPICKSNELDRYYDFNPEPPPNIFGGVDDSVSYFTKSLAESQDEFFKRLRESIIEEYLKNRQNRNARD